MQANDDEKAIVAPYIEDYSDRSFAVFGDTKPFKEELKSLGGRFNKNLKQEGVTMPGWIFPMKIRADVEEVLERYTNKSKYAPLPGSDKKFDEVPYNCLTVPTSVEKHESVGLRPYLHDYSDRSFAVFGDTKPIKEELKSLGGRFNKNLKQEGVTMPGWIFPMKNRADVEMILERSSVISEGTDKKRKRDDV